MYRKSVLHNAQNILFLLLALAITGLSVSCREKKKIVVPPPAEPTQTLLMYMPWSDNLTGFFMINIADMKDAINEGVLEKERVLVYLATSASRASLFELYYDEDGDTCAQQTLKEYELHPFTTVDGIAEVLDDVKRYAPATTYSMTIGSHGMGWLPVGGGKNKQVKASTTTTHAPRYHWESEAEYLTRFFGGTTPSHQTEISTLAKAIEKAGMTMEYILFDDCYMSCIEVAYELRHVTRHFIASTSEIMAYGMPYKDMAIHLLGKIDYEGISQTFHDFYTNYSMPCGTIAMTVTEELDELAALMKEINARYTFDEALTDSLQYLDGYSPHLFFDLGNYVNHLCQDQELLDRFNEQLERAVPSASRKHTPTFYSMYTGRRTPIKHFSGVTISDPSTHYLADPKTETEWYKATH